MKPQEAIVFCSLLFGIGLSTSAQSIESTFTANAQLVVLHATVVNNKGQVVTDLPRSAFTVYEDNVRQSIKGFQREDVPVSLVLIVDNSASMRNKTQEISNAAQAMIKACNRLDEIAIIKFNDNPNAEVPFTDSIPLLTAELSRLDPHGGTAMRDAAGAAVTLLANKAKHEKKVVVIITDGNDTASTQFSLEKVVQKAHEADVAIFSIGFLNDEDRGEAKKAKKALETLAKEAGGVAVFPNDLRMVSSAALSIGSEIRNQYIITYTPANSLVDGRFRTVRVRVRGPNSPRVRTRSGYYANASPESPRPPALRGNDGR